MMWVALLYLYLLQFSAFCCGFKSNLPRSPALHRANHGLRFAGTPRWTASSSMLRMAAEGSSFYEGMDAYQILGVQRSATMKEIKSAYRKLVAQWHPDKFPNDPAKKKEGGERMEKINRAYYCLEDEERRKRYDMYGEQVGSFARSVVVSTFCDLSFSVDR